MSIDLSFTNDPDWIKEREVLWQPREESLKSNFRKKQIKDIKQFFMTGKAGESYKEDAGKLDYFPLQTPEGWDYVFEHVIKDQKFYKKELEYAFQDNSFVAHMALNELARWDYFFSPIFEPTITSRVPIAGTGQKVTVELDPHNVFCRITIPIWTFIEDGNHSLEDKWFKRIEYYWSLWPFITDECFISTGRRSKTAKAGRLIKKLFAHVVNFTPKKSFEDPDNSRPKFLKQLEEKLDEMYDRLCPILQELWDETKVEKIKFEEKQAAQKAKRALARKKKAEEAKKAGGK